MSDQITLQRLHEDMGRTFEAVKQYADKAAAEARKAGDEATAETKAALEKANSALTEIRKDYDHLRRQMQLAKNPGANTRVEDMSEEDQTRHRAFIKYLRHGFGEKAQAIMKPEEQRALSEASDSEGGFLVPSQMEGQIIMAAYDMAEIRPVAQVGTTGRDKVLLPKLAKPTVGWGREGVAVSENDLNAGLEVIEINDLVCLVLISNNTLEDAEADISGELTGAFAMAVAEAEDDAFAAGDGVQKPQGIAVHAGIQANYVATGVAAALSDSSNKILDTLTTALYGLKKVYRRNARFCMNSTVEATLRKVKDTTEQYLWQPPVQAGEPPTLLGRPLVTAENMPAVAANAFPIVVGDFMHYRIRDRRGLSIQRLTERYAEYRQTGFLLTKRVGGAATLAEAFKSIKVATS